MPPAKVMKTSAKKKRDRSAPESETPQSAKKAIKFDTAPSNKSSKSKPDKKKKPSSSRKSSANSSERKSNSYYSSAKALSSSKKSASAHKGLDAWKSKYQTIVPSYDEEDNFLAKYSLDDLRRFARKLMVLGVVDEAQVDNYVKDDGINENTEKVLCTYDEKLEWTTFDIKSTAFTFPEFMTNPVYLASGGFGTVVKCFRYGEPVAVKKVDVPDEDDWEMALRLLRELVVMKQAKKTNCRHICKIIDIFGDPAVKKPSDLKQLYIVMPLYKPGAVDTIEVTDPKLFKTIAGHSLSALHFLHRHKIMHRDIKKENIFYDKKKNRAYLADLGQARRWNGDNMSGANECGTRGYISPEMLQGKKYDYKSDVYSLGQSWYEIACLPSSKILFANTKTKEAISMQKALDPIATKLRGPDSNDPHAAWANEKWAMLEEKKKQWKEDALVSVIELTLMFDPANRADTSRLLEVPYFFPFVSQERTMDLRAVETDNYDEIMQRIFDLQHGSCKHNAKVSSGKSDSLQRMCSIAVQYFATAIGIDQKGSNARALPVLDDDDE